MAIWSEGFGADLNLWLKLGADSDIGVRIQADSDPKFGRKCKAEPTSWKHSDGIAILSVSGTTLPSCYRGLKVVRLDFLEPPFRSHGFLANQRGDHGVKVP